MTTPVGVTSFGLTKTGLYGYLDPFHSYNFLTATFSQGDLLQLQELTFSDNSKGYVQRSNDGVIVSGNEGGLVLSSIEGLTTTPNYSLSVPTFTFGGIDNNFSIEVVFKFNDLAENQGVFRFGNSEVESSIELFRNGLNSNLVFRLLNGKDESQNGIGEGGNLHTTATQPHNDLRDPDTYTTDYVHVVVTYVDLELRSFSHNPNLHFAHGNPLYAGVTISINGVQQEVINSFYGVATQYFGFTNATREIHNIGRSSGSTPRVVELGDNGTTTTKYLKFYNSKLETADISTLYDNYLDTLPSTTPITTTTTTTTVTTPAFSFPNAAFNTGSSATSDPDVTATGAACSIIPKNLNL